MEINKKTFDDWMKKNYGVQEQQNYEGTQTEEICLKFARDLSDTTWISVKDRLPEIGTEVLTYPHYRVLPFGDKELLENKETDTGFWEFDDYFDCPKKANPYPTYWTYLPKPPY